MKERLESIRDDLRAAGETAAADHVTAAIDALGADNESGGHGNPPTGGGTQN